MIEVVLVGCGSISATWLKAAAGISDVKIVGLVDINPEAARKRKQEFGLDAVVDSDLESVLKATKPAAVFDCTVPQSHAQTTLTALSHGCHVLGEKPLADSMEDARRMVEAAVASGLICAVCQNRRYQPEIRALSEWLQSGAIGTLTTLNCDFYIGAHFGGFRERMRHVLLLDMAIHTFDQARLISGADPVAVYCKEWNPRGSWYDHDASAVAVFEMTNGVVFTYRGSWCSEGFNTSWQADWRAIGETGTALWNGEDAPRAQVTVQRGGFFSAMEDVAVPQPPSAKSGGHEGVIREFVECIRTGTKPETICTDNIKSLAMVFSAIESSEKGCRVNIDV